MTTFDFSQTSPQLALHANHRFRKSIAGIIKHLFPPAWLWLAGLAIIGFDYCAFHFGHKFLIDTQKFWQLGIYSLGAFPIAWWMARGENAQSFMSRPLRLFALPAYLGPVLAGLALFDYVVMANDQPLVQPLLNSWDRSLGLDWFAYANFVGHHPWLALMMQNAYDLMIKGLLVVMGLCIIQGKPERCTELIALTFATAIAAMIIGSYFPASSAMTYLGTDALKALFPPETGSIFEQSFMEARGSIPMLLDPMHTQGITQFPSFHMVCGILIIYGARGAWWKFYPALAFSLLLMAATPIYGGHYFVDLIAGAFLASAAIAISQIIVRLISRRKQDYAALNKIAL